MTLVLVEEYSVASVELEGVGSSEVVDRVTVEMKTEVSEELDESTELLNSNVVVVDENKEYVMVSAELGAGVLEEVVGEDDDEEDSLDDGSGKEEVLLTE